MYILGLTGSIAMGKTVAADAFRSLGVAVFDADAEVHRLTGPEGAAIAGIAALLPEIANGGQIDRRDLAAAAFDDPAVFAKLETVLHPLVGQAQIRFLRNAATRGQDLVVLDVPLLFETGGDRSCDAVAVVSAPKFLQEIRVLARSGMTADRFHTILRRQIPDVEKRRRAEFIIPTGLGRDFSLRRIQKIVKVVSSRLGRNWPASRYRADRARR